MRNQAARCDRNQQYRVGGPLPLLRHPPSSKSFQRVHSADDEPEYPSQGSFGHKHKLLVDKLHGQMVRAGRLLNELDPATLLNKEPTDETMQQWFPGGMKLQRPNKNAQQGGGQ